MIMISIAISMYLCWHVFIVLSFFFFFFLLADGEDEIPGHAPARRAPLEEPARARRQDADGRDEGTESQQRSESAQG